MEATGNANFDFWLHHGTAEGQLRNNSTRKHFHFPFPKYPFNSRHDPMVTAVYRASQEPQNRNPTEWAHYFHPHSISRSLRHHTLMTVPTANIFTPCNQHLPKGMRARQEKWSQMFNCFKSVMVLHVSALAMTASILAVECYPSAWLVAVGRDRLWQHKEGDWKRMLKHHLIPGSDFELVI